MMRDGRLNHEQLVDILVAPRVLGDIPILVFQ